MKSSRRNPFLNPFLRSALVVAAAVFCNSSLYAVDYSFGSITSDFTITASDQAREGGWAMGSFNDNGWGGVYDRGANRDVTYMHFDLTSLAGMTINGSVNLNLGIDATYGGAINSGVVGYANSAWSYPGATPGFTTISGADPSGNYSNGQTATAAINNPTFQGFVNNPTTFYGLAITAGAGSGAHFNGPAMLTGNYTGGEVRVLGGTDWSAAAWDNGSKILSIAGSSDVTGGLVAMVSGTTLSVGDSATLGGGSFSGAIGSNGTLVFGSSANQTLSGAISGSGVLNKTGSGTLTLSGANSYTGLTAVSTGTLSLASSNALPTTGVVTIGSGATLSNDAPASTSFNIGNITLNGGTLAATSSPSATLGNFHLKGNVTVGGSTMSTISADVRVIQNDTRSFTVADVDGGSGVDLLVSGRLGHFNGNSWGYATKEGAGTMKLTGPVEIGGITVNAGKLVLEDSAANWGAFATGLTNNSQVEVNVTSGSRTLGVNSSGSGSMVKSGAGSLTLTGYNSGNGGITINEGTLVADRSQQDHGIHTLGFGALTINNGGTLRSTVNWTTGSEWNGTSVGAVIINNGGTWSIEALGQTIRNGLFLNGGSITSSISNADWGALNLKSGVTAGGGVTSSIGADTALFSTQTITVDGGSQLNYSGVIHNQYGSSGGITKAGGGTLVLSGASSYTGSTTVSGGTLVVNGNISTSTTTVESGGTLGGSGTVGSLIVQAGGTVSPGNSPGILNVDGDYSQSGTLVIEVNGLTPGSQHDQVNVDRLSGDGSVTLSGSLSVLFGGGTYVNGSLLFILLNDGSDAVNGTFSGYAQNDIVATFGGFDWMISYNADSSSSAFTGGNDVALMAVPEPEAALLGGLGVLLLLRRRR